MNKTRYIYSKAGQLLYDEVARDLPIADYHCHLSPKEIYEDKPFDNIGVMWLEKDHYKWRLMRAFGIEEQYITGKAGWKDKFFAYCKAIEHSPGNPLYHDLNGEQSLFVVSESSVN